MSANAVSAESTAVLFTPTRLGAFELAHRVVMAPLTRLRSRQPGNIPRALNAEYYHQRASRGGLIISEATQVAPEGQGYPQSPGIHSHEQVEGWRAVTDAVHAKGGLIVLQLWHVGRISHPSLQPGGVLPVAPSAIRPAGMAMTPTFEQVPFVEPRALETREIPGVVEQFRCGAENAKAAGFDGVEIHGANGYLLDQFLRDGTNVRTDQYGGSIVNRSRFVVEVAEAVTGVWGPERVGIRFSPFGTFNDMRDSNAMAQFRHIIGEMARLRMAYIHLVEPRADQAPDAAPVDLGGKSIGGVFRDVFPGAIINAGGYDGPGAARAVARREAEAVAFGRWFISNPDLPERIRRGVELTPYDRSTFYGGDGKGYTDYPFAAK